MNRENFMKRNQMLTEIAKREETQTNIAKKYNVSEAYVSQLSTLFKRLKYPPKIINNTLVCFKCEIDKKPLVFHHNHISGQYIALVCHSCNLKFVDNEISYKTREQRLVDKVHKKEYEIRKILSNSLLISKEYLNWLGSDNYTRCDNLTIILKWCKESFAEIKELKELIKK